MNGTEKVVAAVKKASGKVPIIAKLSPNVVEIGEIAKSCEAAGAIGPRYISRRSALCV